jgi:uncharacterized protein YbaR (Trm112 family)
MRSAQRMLSGAFCGRFRRARTGFFFSTRSLLGDAQAAVYGLADLLICPYVRCFLSYVGRTSGERAAHRATRSLVCAGRSTAFAERSLRPACIRRTFLICSELFGSFRRFRISEGYAYPERDRGDRNVRKRRRGTGCGF